MILILSYSTRSEIIVVNVPAPASNGNAIGTILPEAFSMLSDLKKRWPRIISKPIKNITRDPAMANEEISIPNNPKIDAPKKRKLIIIIAETIVAVLGEITTPSFFMLIIIGSEPMISITEKRMTVTVSTEVKFMG